MRALETHIPCATSPEQEGEGQYLCCGNGFGLTAREGIAPCAATHHFSLSRVKNTRLSVLPSEMQLDEKFRAFCVSKWPQEPGEQPCLQRKQLSGIFPHGHGCVWLHSAEVVWEEAQSGVCHLSLLPSAHLRQGQPGPALPTPPSLESCPSHAGHCLKQLPT